MALVFSRLADALDIAGTPVEQNWKATDDLTQVSISKNYPLTDTQAAIEADLAAIFPVNPVVSSASLDSLKVLKKNGTYKIVNDDGKVLLELSSDAAGNVSLQMVDATGNKRRVLTPQSGSVKMDGAATIVDVVFEEPMIEHPVLTLTPSKPLPNYDLNVGKTGFTVDFASPPVGTVAWSVQSNKRG